MKDKLVLRYVKNSKKVNAWMGEDARMWDIVEPLFPEYQHTIGRTPTFSRESLLQILKEKGII